MYGLHQETAIIAWLWIQNGFGKSCLEIDDQM